MKHYWKLIVCAIMSIAILMMSGCSSDDGPKVDYSQLRIGHMDLSGAVSIGLKNNNGSSRAIDGEYLSAGLYKVDAQGNISAVGVYFTTDNQGNRLEHEEVLRVVPEELYNLTDNYMLVRDCEYYDCDGDVVGDHYVSTGEDDGYWVQQAVPYKNLLVRKSDGKIWCVDNIFEMLYRAIWLGGYKEDAAGALYFYEGSYGNVYVYKFNLQEDSSSLEQLTSSGKTQEHFHIAYNGVIWSYNYIHSPTMMFEWPQSGFQGIYSHIVLADIGDKLAITIPGGTFRDRLGNEIHTDSIKMKPAMVALYPIEFQYKPYLMIVPGAPIFLDDDGHQMPNLDAEGESRRKEAFSEVKVPIAGIYEIELGSSPGSAKCADTPMMQLFDSPEDALADGYTWGRYIFGQFYQDDSNFLTQSNEKWVIKIDMVNHTWKWLKKLAVRFDFSGSMTYSGKIWNIDSSRDNFGAYWFDPVSYDEGFVKFNVNLPSLFFDERDYEYSNGKMIYSAQDPATGNYVKIVIDITTGEAITDEQAPEYLFETIINLN